MLSVEQIVSELQHWETAENRFHPINSILKDVPRGSQIYKKDLLRKLSNELKAQNAEMVEFLISIINYDGVDDDYTDILCMLLKEDWHYMHEDIVMMLEKLSDPRSISCILKRALIIPEADDGRSLAKKCIWALGAINTSEAREALLQLAQSIDTIVSEAARIELEAQVR